MANIINLRQARKLKARADDERKARENREVFGRSKSDKERQALERAASARLLDGSKRDRPDEQG